MLDLLRERGLTLALAESLTGGLVASRLTAIPGASDVFRGGVVSYASEVKFDLLEVSPGPVVNEPAAIEMAEGVQRLLGADIGLSLTGVAGPTEQDGVPVGTVCIAVALPTGSHAVDRAPRHAARAGPPVRRHQQPRPPPPPPPADRRDLTGFPNYSVRRSDPDRLTEELQESGRPAGAARRAIQARRSRQDLNLRTAD